jgi:hypothetical protein
MRRRSILIHLSDEQKQLLEQHSNYGYGKCEDFYKAILVEFIDSPEFKLDLAVQRIRRLERENESLKQQNARSADSGSGERRKHGTTRGERPKGHRLRERLGARLTKPSVCGIGFCKVHQTLPPLGDVGRERLVIRGFDDPNGVAISGVRPPWAFWTPTLERVRLFVAWAQNAENGPRDCPRESVAHAVSHAETGGF